MTNIYVSPLASPSFECLSGAVERPPNEFPLTGEDKQERVRNLDENGNEVFETVRKKSGKMKGHELETPSGTITTISVSPGTEDGSSPRRSPVYCFHSFTYGVSGSNGNVAGLRDSEKAPAELNGTAVWEDESFDADSPNVWRTRTVVDPDESGSPRFLCEWNMGETAECLSNDSLSSKETSLTEPSKAIQSEINVDLQNAEAVNANGTDKMTTDKGLTLPATKEDENSTYGSCDNAAKAPIRRLSPEGAECYAVDAQISDATGDTSGYLTVPGKRVVSIQRRDFVGSPSGRLDVKDYWMWDDVVEAREVVDGDFQDHIPLIGPEKSHKSYTIEEGLEEAEGVPVTCFPCRDCVIL